MFKVIIEKSFRSFANCIYAESNTYHERNTDEWEESDDYNP